MRLQGETEMNLEDVFNLVAFGTALTGLPATPGMDLDRDGVDRAGNPDFLTLDQPSPAGAFAYNTILVDLKKTNLEHHPGWDTQATSRSVIFRRDK